MANSAETRICICASFFCARAEANRTHEALTADWEIILTQVVQLIPRQGRFLCRINEQKHGRIEGLLRDRPRTHCSRINMRPSYMEGNEKNACLNVVYIVVWKTCVFVTAAWHSLQGRPISFLDCQKPVRIYPSCVLLARACGVVSATIAWTVFRMTSVTYLNEQCCGGSFSMVCRSNECDIVRIYILLID